jgi:GR25 family glycosyltransferase involved in LPS biosynthesis
MKYSIIHVDNRASKNIKNNKNILKDFEFVDIEFFDGRNGGGWTFLNNMGVNTSAWNPYDGRTLGPLPGEYGVWVSTILFFEYMIKNSIEEMILLEDDIILDYDFVDKFFKIKKDLPNSFDFLSMSFPLDQNKQTKKSSINSELIHKSINQYANGQATLYTLNCAKKILKLLKRKGLEYTSDCFIFKQSHLGLLEGYSIIPNAISLIKSDTSVSSSIDPKNVRNV